MSRSYTRARAAEKPTAQPVAATAVMRFNTEVANESNLFNWCPSLDHSQCPGCTAGSQNHASETHGCPQARALFPRVLLAPASGRWSLLPGVPALRGRIQVRLGHHAPDRAR